MRPCPRSYVCVSLLPAQQDLRPVSQKVGKAVAILPSVLDQQSPLSTQEQPPLTYTQGMIRFITQKSNQCACDWHWIVG